MVGLLSKIISVFSAAATAPVPVINIAQSTEDEFQKYDDASWHYDGAETDEEAERASVHIGIFVKWLISQDFFLGVPDEKDDQKAILEVKNGDKSGRAYTDYWLDGKIFSSHISEAGNRFLEVYYSATSNGIGGHHFLDDYDKLFNGKLPNEETSEIYNKVAKMIDERYREFTTAPARKGAD